MAENNPFVNEFDLGQVLSKRTTRNQGVVQMASIYNHFAKPKTNFSGATELMTRGRAALARLVRVLQLWSARTRQRQHLAKLSFEHLEDIGVSADDANAEAAKPFWQA
jgi:uncharacterized protein YjiS (DUF1127 family)